MAVFTACWPVGGGTHVCTVAKKKKTKAGELVTRGAVALGAYIRVWGFIIGSRTFELNLVLSLGRTELPGTKANVPFW